jgi:hypothetical protein
MEYRRISKGLFEKVEVVGTISLSELEAQIAELQVQLDIPEPTDEEFLDMGKASSPYYGHRLRAQEEMETARALLTELRRQDITVEQ